MQTAQFLLRDQQGVDFKACTGSLEYNERVLTLHSSMDPTSPTLALVDRKRPYSKTHLIVLPPAPGQEQPDAHSQPQYPVQKVEHLIKTNRIDIPPPYEESYEWQRAKKEEHIYTLVRLRDNQVMCRAELVNQSNKVVVENGQTLRATVTFEGKGLVPEELNPYARLAICAHAVDFCHYFVNDRLRSAIKYQQDLLKKEAKKAKKANK